MSYTLENRRAAAEARDIKVLRLIRAKAPDGYMVSELAKMLRCNVNTMRDCTKRLRRLGLIVSTHPGMGGHHSRLTVPEVGQVLHDKLEAKFSRNRDKHERAKIRQDYQARMANYAEFESAADESPFLHSVVPAHMKAPPTTKAVRSVFELAVAM